LTIAFAADGLPCVVVGVHDAMPENALPENETATGWLYHPFVSGGRAAVAVAVGDEISTRSGYGNGIDGPPDQLTSHSRTVSVSLLYVVATLHDGEGLLPLSGLICHANRTVVVYHDPAGLHCAPCGAF
jgi:hypothetical protein